MRAFGASLAFLVATCVAVAGCSGDTTTTVIKNTTVSEVTTTATESTSQTPATYGHSDKCGDSAEASYPTAEHPKPGYYDVRVFNADCRFGLAVAEEWTTQWEFCQDGCKTTVKGLECVYKGPPSGDVACSYGNPTVRFRFYFSEDYLQGE